MAQKAPVSARANRADRAEDLAAWDARLLRQPRDLDSNLDAWPPLAPDLEITSCARRHFGQPRQRCSTAAFRASTACRLSHLRAAPESGARPVRAPASFAAEVLLSRRAFHGRLPLRFRRALDLGHDERPGTASPKRLRSRPATPLPSTLRCSSMANPRRRPALRPPSSPGAPARSSSIRLPHPFFLVVSYPGAGPAYDGLTAKYLDLYKTAGFQTLGIQPASPSALDGKDRLADPLASIRQAAAAVSALDEQVGAVQRSLIQRGCSRTRWSFSPASPEILGRHGLWGSGYASNRPTSSRNRFAPAHSELARHFPPSPSVPNWWPRRFRSDGL